WNPTIRTPFVCNWTPIDLPLGTTFKSSRTDTSTFLMGKPATSYKSDVSQESLLVNSAVPEAFTVSFEASTVIFSPNSGTLIGKWLSNVTMLFGMERYFSIDVIKGADKRAISSTNPVTIRILFFIPYLFTLLNPTHSLFLSVLLISQNFTFFKVLHH